MSGPHSTRGRRRPTLEQVARYAGVSRATVSRVVNRASTVDPTLRATVEQAIADLNYVPNHAARSLMTRRTDTVALVASETEDRVFGDPFFAQVLRGASSRLTESGVQLTLIMTHAEDDPAPLVRYLTGGHVDGVLSISEHGGGNLVRTLVEASVPVVVGGRPVDPGVDVSFVDNDNVDGARQAARHLRSLGRRRIATITGPQDMSAGVDRLTGFRSGVGKLFRTGLVAHGDFTTESGTAAVATLLDHDPDIDGLFCASDLMALGALSELRRRGRRVPDDVAVVGFDDIELAALADPPLTTMRQLTVDQGRQMAALLLEQLNGGTDTAGEPRSVVQPVELVIRESA